MMTAMEAKREALCVDILTKLRATRKWKRLEKRADRCVKKAAQIRQFKTLLPKPLFWSNEEFSLFCEKYLRDDLGYTVSFLYHDVRLMDNACAKVQWGTESDFPPMPAVKPAKPPGAE